MAVILMGLSVGRSWGWLFAVSTTRWWSVYRVQTTTNNVCIVIEN